MYMKEPIHQRGGNYICSLPVRGGRGERLFPSRTHIICMVRARGCDALWQNVTGVGREKGVVSRDGPEAGVYGVLE